MRIQEIIMEKLSTNSIQQIAYDKILIQLKDSRSEAREKLSNIKDELSTIADNIVNEFPSDVKNQRGYALSKMVVTVSIHPSTNFGGSLSTKAMDGIRHAVIRLNVDMVDSFVDGTMSDAMIEQFAVKLSEAFSHEMQHVLQEIQHKKISDPKEIDKFKKTQSVGTSSGEQMTAEKRARYLASINETDAYAGNAARSIKRRYGDNSINMLQTNLNEIIRLIPEVQKYYAIVKPYDNNAWNRFLKQIYHNLTVD